MADVIRRCIVKTPASEAPRAAWQCARIDAHGSVQLAAMVRSQTFAEVLRPLKRPEPPSVECVRNV
jgi:hypothetical protein